MARGRRGYIRLKADRFDLMTRVVGCESEEARAFLLGVDPKTVARARRRPADVNFIAQTLYALGCRRDELAVHNLVPRFDELFDVVEVPRLIDRARRALALLNSKRTRPTRTP